MRLVVYINSGPRQGQRLLLRTGQRFCLGRTEWADVALPNDELLSNVHFSMEVTRGRCIVRDLESCNGTWLNDRQIVQAELCGGDRLRAGRTHFRIEIDWEGVESRDDLLESRYEQTVPADSSVPGGWANVTTETCPSGLLTCRGGCGLLAPSQLASAAGQAYQLTVILDVNKLPANASPQLPKDISYLLDWLPDAARQIASPVVLTNCELQEAGVLIDQAWGKDAVVCVFSMAEAGVLLGKLRAASGLLMRPSILTQYLIGVQSSPVDGLFQTVQGVLVEGKEPDNWALFGTEQFVEGISKLHPGLCTPRLLQEDR